jgi:hypothetical protein
LMFTLVHGFFYSLMPKSFGHFYLPGPHGFINAATGDPP